jgi:hypothetical protein
MALNPKTLSISQSSKAMTMKDDPVDMSRRAVAQRLEQMRRLCDLMSYLAQFRPFVEAAENARKAKP